MKQGQLSTKRGRIRGARNLILPVGPLFGWLKATQFVDWEGRQQVVAAEPGFAGSPSLFCTIVAPAYNECVI